METLFYVGLIFVLGAFTGWLSILLHMPRVVGYLLLGLLIGPEVFEIVPQEFVENSGMIIEIALSIIALLVGATLNFSTLKAHAKEVLSITIFQSLSTFIIVFIGFIFFNSIFSLAIQEIIILSLFLAGIATATDTAAPMAIIHELKAKGKFTSTYLAVIAFDDAISLIIFSLAVTTALTLNGGDSFGWNNIVEAIQIVFLSSIIGVIAALINTQFEKLFLNNKAMDTISTLGLIFIVYSLSEYWQLEPLLSAMVMGVTMSNTSNNFKLVEEEIDTHLMEIIFMLFFMISAMHLNFNALFSIPFIIIMYVLLRFFGKVFGAYIGATVSKSSMNIKKYMGLALLPQAGVAIGLALSLQKDPSFSNIAPIILNIVIATTLIYEIVGPLLTRYAIEKAGESHKDEN